MENEPDKVRIVLAAGTTRTAAIEGISAAGADPAARVHTPSADAEVLVYGRPVRAPTVPVSPTGCPTPAVVSRAVRELVAAPVAVVDAGLAAPTGAPTVDVGASPGGDVREDEPVPGAAAILETAREFGRELPDEEVFVAETIPGGTTTALGVLRALDAGGAVSSSLPSNPLARKREVVDAALAAAPFDPPADPVAALRRAGDPVLATAAGVTSGALAAGTDVTLAGGTQLLAVAALVRALCASGEGNGLDGRGGRDGRLRIATTSFVADDPSARFRETAADLGLDATVTDPGFDGWDHPVAERYEAGEAKEGVGMGGALALADRAGVPTIDVRERIATVYDRLLDEEPSGERRNAVPGGGA